MSLTWYDNYISNMAQTPKESWKGLNQASIDNAWQDTTQLRTIKEQVYPFSDKYTEYNVWVSTVSDISVNTDKTISNFIYVLFQDCTHTLNHRGQKYLYKLDGTNESTFLCYDKMNELSQVADTKLVMCNNRIKAKKSDGSIWEEPCYIGWELSSTRAQISKEGTIPNARLVCMCQYNDNTKDITINQRFILSHKMAFAVEQLDNFNLENTNDDAPTLLTMYIKWDSLLPTDDLDNNLADSGINVYSIEINQDTIEQKKNYSGKLTSTVKLNGEVVSDIPLGWSTSDSSIVTVDSSGNYQLVGESGSSAVITCYMTNNTDVKDTINVSIVSDYLGEKVIQVSPVIFALKEQRSQEFVCGVYINGDKQTDEVVCTPNWTGTNYTLTETIDGYKLTNNNISSNPLVLTFTSGSCEPVTMTIKLMGLL